MNIIFDDEDEEYYSPSEVFTSLSSLSNSKINTKINMINNNNKKRFSDEQVRSLESIFENETKLDPKKKVEVATQLGLQPRQVAIWFQNKRARYKSKQLERDYSLLKSNFDSLSSQFEILKNERQSLLSQVEKLKELVEKGEAENYQNYNETRVFSDSSVSQSESDNSNKSDESKGNPWETLSEYGSSMLRLVEPMAMSGSLTSVECWDELRDHPLGLFDQDVDSCLGLDFWS